MVVSHPVTKKERTALPKSTHQPCSCLLCALRCLCSVRFAVTPLVALLRACLASLSRVYAYIHVSCRGHAHLAEPWRLQGHASLPPSLNAP